MRDGASQSPTEMFHLLTHALSYLSPFQTQLGWRSVLAETSGWQRALIVRHTTIVTRVIFAIVGVNPSVEQE